MRRPKNEVRKLSLQLRLQIRDDPDLLGRSDAIIVAKKTLATGIARRADYLPLPERKMNRPRMSKGRPCVRARFDGVEMPLKRMKKSKNARQKPFLISAAILGKDLLWEIAGERSGALSSVYLTLESG